MLTSASSRSSSFSGSPSSPRATFQPRSSYHAQSSSSAYRHSPRFQSGITSRQSPALSAKSPAGGGPPSSLASTTESVTVTKKSYVDAGTQYTPEDWPPTSSRFTVKATVGGTQQEDESATAGGLQERRTNTEKGKGKGKRRETSSSPGPTPITDPPEPSVRESPQKSTSESDSMSRRSVTRASDAHPSPTKKARPSDAPVKVMPRRYELCDVKELGVLISDMIMELVRLNDDIPLRDGQLTRFHSRAPPGISVKDYLKRIIIHATLSPPLLLSMVYYIDRLCAMYPAFTISSLTVHRFLITAATVAAKGLSDSFWTNNTYARVGGVSTKELALLELEFLSRVEWRIVPAPEDLEDYYKSLIERSEGYALEQEPEPAAAEEKSAD